MRMNITTGRSQRYHVRRVGIVACAKFGCVGGLLAALPFGLLAGLLVYLVINVVRQALEGWQQMPVELGLASTSLDVVTLLRLDMTLTRLQLLDGAPLVVVGVVTLALMALLGLVGGGLGGLGAFVYNAIATFSGGVKMELESEGR